MALRPSTGSRRRAREIALQILYQADGNPDLDAEEALALYFGQLAAPLGSAQGASGGGPSAPLEEGVFAPGESYDRALTETLVRGTLGARAEIDELLTRVSRTWRLERMARLDRNVLRMAVFELRFLPEVPIEVVINEAVDLAKRFGSAEAAAFVNGVLDSALTAGARRTV